MPRAWIDDILRVLDAATDRAEFPALGNANQLVARARLTAFRAEEEWLIVFDVVAIGGSPDFEIGVYAFGNCLPRDPPNVAMMPYAPPTIESPRAAFETKGFEGCNHPDPFDFTLIVRGKPVRFQPTAEDYKRARIRLGSDYRSAHQQLRYAVTQLRDEVFLTDEEILKACGRDGAGLSKFIQTTAWQHTEELDCAEADSTPSKCVTFSSLAAALAADDPSLFNPGTDNTDWKLWYPDDTI